MIASPSFRRQIGTPQGVRLSEQTEQLNGLSVEIKHSSVQFSRSHFHALAVAFTLIAPSRDRT